MTTEFWRKNALLLHRSIKIQCANAIRYFQARGKFETISVVFGDIVCFDVFSPSTRNKTQINRDDMTVRGRILITSKRPADSLPLRKPIKGCYCNHQEKNIQYCSARTISKPHWPCNYCKSNFDIRLPTPQHHKQDSTSPTLSCKTLQKVQRINYTPRSEFLRRVQKKVSQHYNVCGVNRFESSVTSPRFNENVCCDDRRNIEETSNESREADYRTCVRETEVLNHYSKGKKLPKTLRIVESNSDYTRISDARPCESQTGISGRRSEATRSKSMSRESKIPHNSSFNKEKCVQTPEIKTIFPSCKNSKSQMSSRKTDSCGKQSYDPPDREIISKSTLKSKKKSRVLSQKKSCCNNYCPIMERTKNSTNSSKKSDYTNCTKCCRCKSRLCPAFVSHNDIMDEETTELRKFREKNYFDTHGSRQTLSSSPQSSLEQFQLNDRLFPKLVGKINRDDLVVSMPICMTKQLKRIHYFPRHIVKQQSSVPPICPSKKGRYHSCPLTGHAIDLGALKVSCPVNSLALKFQKGVA